jgi:hypothetical protein
MCFIGKVCVHRGRADGPDDEGNCVARCRPHCEGDNDGHCRLGTLFRNAAGNRYRQDYTATQASCSG